MNNIPVSWVGKLLQQLTHSAFLRLFDIRAGIAFAEVLPVEANRDADFQDAAVIQIGSLLHNGKRNIGRDDHGLACQQPLVNHIEYALLDKAGVVGNFCPMQGEESCTSIGQILPSGREETCTLSGICRKMRFA